MGTRMIPRTHRGLEGIGPDHSCAWLAFMNNDSNQPCAVVPCAELAMAVLSIPDPLPDPPCRSSQGSRRM